MQTVAPTVLDPIAALTENKDWSGRQIARQDFSKLNLTPGYTPREGHCFIAEPWTSLCTSTT